MKKFFQVLIAVSILFLSACATQKEVAESRKYVEPRFRDTQPIQLLVNQVNIESEFSPTFTKPNVEHLFPISLERAARIWATDRLKATDYSVNRQADFIIKNASVTEEFEKSADLFRKDRLKYRAELSVILKVTDQNGSTAQTSIDAWRELGIPADTQIDQKEKYWYEMIQKLMTDFDAKMEQDANQYLNMYIKNSTSILEY